MTPLDQVRQELVMLWDRLGPLWGISPAAGRVTEVSPGAVTQASTAFGWPVTPWCPDMF